MSPWAGSEHCPQSDPPAPSCPEWAAGPQTSNPPWRRGCQAPPAPRTRPSCRWSLSGLPCPGRPYRGPPTCNGNILPQSPNSKIGFLCFIRGEGYHYGEGILAKMSKVENVSSWLWWNHFSTDQPSPTCSTRDWRRPESVSAEPGPDINTINTMVS